MRLKAGRYVNLCWTHKEGYPMFQLAEVLKDFDTKEVLKEFEAAPGSDKDGISFRVYLTENGYINTNVMPHNLWVSVKPTRSSGNDNNK